MKSAKWLWAIGCLVVAALLWPSVAHAEVRTHVVRRGENLTTIARYYGVTVQALMQENRLQNPNLVWAGQQLRIPSPAEVTPSANAPALPSGASGTWHVVRAGENLSSIAARYGKSVSAIAAANGLWNLNLIYTGQRLRIPQSEAGETATLSVSAQAQGTTGKWIEIDLSHSTVTAWQGAIRVRQMLASLGLPGTPTPAGRFTILSKYPSVAMSGPGYYLPGVPHTMFFYRGYAIHGAYWHNNFGRPMSHGCVNLSLADAAWLYGWTPLGTPVVSHW